MLPLLPDTAPHNLLLPVLKVAAQGKPYCAAVLWAEYFAGLLTMNISSLTEFYCQNLPGNLVLSLDTKLSQ